MFLSITCSGVTNGIVHAAAPALAKQTVTYEFLM